MHVYPTIFAQQLQWIVRSRYRSALTVIIIWPLIIAVDDVRAFSISRGKCSLWFRTRAHHPVVWSLGHNILLLKASDDVTCFVRKTRPTVVIPGTRSTESKCRRDERIASSCRTQRWFWYVLRSLSCHHLGPGQ